jgi:excisionase family DNA binding protein
MTAGHDWPDFNTVPEAAAIMRVSKMTVYRMIHAGAFGEGGVVRIGRSFRIRSSALEALTRIGTVREKESA